MSTNRLSADEQRIGDQITTLCEPLRDEAVEHILAAGLMTIAEMRGVGARFDQDGWSVVVDRTERIRETPA